MKIDHSFQQGHRRRSVGGGVHWHPSFKQKQ